MQTLQKYKKILIWVTVIVLAFAGYNFFGSSDALTTGEEAQTIGADVLELNKGLNKVTLDRAPLNTNLYRSLSDWSPNLIEQPVGRPNPFAPIGE